MLISAQHIDTYGSGADLSVYESMDLTFNAYNLIIVIMASAFSGGSPDPAISGTAGLNLVEIAQHSQTVGQTPHRNLRIYRGMPITNLNGTIKFDWGSNVIAGILWNIHKFDNVKKTGSDGADAIRQVVYAAKENGTGINSITLAALGHTDNGFLAAFMQSGNTTPTLDADFTQMGSIAYHANPNSQAIVSGWHINDTIAGVSWSAPYDNIGIGLEIVADQTTAASEDTNLLLMDVG